MLGVELKSKHLALDSSSAVSLPKNAVGGISVGKSLNSSSRKGFVRIVVKHDDCKSTPSENKIHPYRT